MIKPMMVNRLVDKRQDMYEELHFEENFLKENKLVNAIKP